jgi:hypothetical protein
LIFLPFALSLAVSVHAAPSSKQEMRLPVFDRSKTPAKVLYHLDMMQSPLDERFAMTVLQGLVNREQPRLYISQNPEWHGTMSFQRWMDDLKSRGHAFEPVAPEEALGRFRALVKGAVLYESGLEKEPESLHKLNAVTLYCAVYDCLPVTPELNERLRLPVVLDVRDKLNSAQEAYEWAYRELWPKANKRLLAHTCPTHMVLRDYLVQHKGVPFWISKGTTIAGDDAAQRLLREGEPNSPLMGCWGGYGEQPPGRYSEPDLQRVASEYGKFIVVTDGCFNLSVFSGLDYRHSAPPKRAPAPRLDPSKVYIVFNVTDGDNLQYLQQCFVSGQWWLDPSRGKVPISWSLGPTAAELIPNVVEYLQATATPNDEFVCSTAGIGLMTPALYGANLTVDRDVLHNSYLRATSRAMKVVGQSAIHLGDTSLVPWTRADFDRCAREMPEVKLILGDYGKTLGVFPGNSSYTVSRDVLVLRALASLGAAKDDEERANKIAESVRNYTPKHRPAFMHASLVNWFVTPTAIARAAELLGPDYVPVLPSQIVGLYRQARISPIQ